MHVVFARSLLSEKYIKLTKANFHCSRPLTFWSPVADIPSLVIHGSDFRHSHALLKTSRRWAILRASSRLAASRFLIFNSSSGSPSAVRNESGAIFSDILHFSPGYANAIISHFTTQYSLQRIRYCLIESLPLLHIYFALYGCFFVSMVSRVRVGEFGLKSRKKSYQAICTLVRINLLMMKI